MNIQEFNFDRVYPRHQSDSIKWRRYGSDVLPLWVADMDFAVPLELITAVRDRLSHPIFGYSCEDDELRDLIVMWIWKRQRWKIQPESILFMSGVVTGMNWVAQSLLTDSKGVAFLTPIYPPFFHIAPHAGCHSVEIPLLEGKHEYLVDFDRMEKALDDRIGILFLCNPHNPVGRVFTRVELEKIGEICLKKNILICSDEIHCDLIYSGHKHISMAALSNDLLNRTVTLMAPSKTFNIPGLHLSFAIVSNPELRVNLERGRRGLVSTPNLLANAAVRGAYLHGERWLDALVYYLEQNRDFLTNYCRNHLAGVRLCQPQGTYLAWLDCRGIYACPNPGEFFLNKARVALNNGIDFGREGNGFVRLNFGCPRSILTEALERMQAAIHSA